MARDQIEGHYRVLEMVRTFLVHQVYRLQPESEYGQEETQRSVGLTGLWSRGGKGEVGGCHGRYCSHWCLVPFIRDY